MTVSNARKRLHLLSPQDGGDSPLVEKVLGRELSNRESQRAFVTEFLAADGKARG